MKKIDIAQRNTTRCKTSSAVKVIEDKSHTK